MIRGAFIGIDRHADPLIRDLNGAARDAKALWALFSDSVADLQAPLLVDGDASLDAVRRALDETLGAAGKDDVVLLSFAGHGTPDHRLVLADSETGRLTETTLDMGDLAARFRTTKARAVILLLDCCFSGGAPARVLDLGYVARDLGMPLAEIAGKGRILFAASAHDEPALEDPRDRHGLFSKALIDCLVARPDGVNVMALVEEVTRAVAANALRLGYLQTPTIFGHVEGELTLPAGRRGNHDHALFPELAPVVTSGDIMELPGFGIPLAVAKAWQEQYPGGLNNLQVAALNEHGVLSGRSLLVVAPTSAGKTFIGEIAAIKAVGDGRRAIFLLPYKALVNEKYEDFAALYGERLGLRVVRCSGDWQDQVGDVLRGKFDIAFFTYEKFLGLCVAFPHILHQLGLVVLDEAQFITDPGRGMAVELILTNFRSSRQRGVAPQLVALSAVIGNTNQLEHWLDCGLLTTNERPVPLTQGVIDRTGAWQFRTETGETGIAQLLDRYAIQQRRSKPSSQDVIVPLIRELVGRGEKIIVFRNQRGSSAGCAEYLANELGLPPATAVIDSLPEGDPSSASPRLRRTLEGGVAFHMSDLNREERVAIERGFRARDGGIHVLVATSTVAAGINTPASTVVIVETHFPGAGEPQPYTVAQFRNMAGRAGRLGYENEGKAIAIADTAYDRNRIFQKYVEGAPEPMRSSFDSRQPGTWLMRLLAQVQSVPRASVIELIANTYGGFLAILRNPAWRETMAADVEDLLTRMIRDGLIEEEGGNLRLSILGRACGESPLSLESSMRLVEMLQRLGGENVPLEDLLALTEALPERDEDYTPQNRHGEPRWAQDAASRFGNSVVRLMRHRAESDKAHYGRCKRALIVADWIAGASMNDIETGYSTNAFFSRVGAGDIRGFADGTRFLFESVQRISAIVTGNANDPGEVEILLKRLDLGLPAEALALTELPVRLDRGDVLALWRDGLVTADAVAAAGVDRLLALIGGRAKTLLRRLEAMAPAGAA
jgi:replicative superfamily II helicase